MTLFLPLDLAEECPQTPGFLSSPHDPEGHLNTLLKTIRKARRITVVSGAGISVHAGIPDFRSSEGLFQTLKRDNPNQALTSGKDLFDASVFNAEYTTSIFCQMIAELARLSQEAQPTPFHRVLRSLDDRGQLLRVYTQNIDAIESKCGLSFGVPETNERRLRSKTKAKLLDDELTNTTADAARLPSPPVETPRCIPLHGTLQTMHCETCTHSFPLQEHLEVLSSGSLAYCPECTALEETRQLVGKRARGVGKLRPSVVLYNEVHKDGEGVGEVVRKDLTGGGKGRAPPDLLLVVGTSLRVPGTKRIVREFSRAVRSRVSPASDGASTSRLPTPSPSPRRTPAAGEDPPLRTVYLNYDFPVPTREWEGVFDVWVKGDAQDFARMLQQAIDEDAQQKAATAQRRQARGAEANAARRKKAAAPPTKANKKRKASHEAPHRTAKRRRTLPTPPPSGADGRRGRVTVRVKPSQKTVARPFPSLVEPDARHRSGIVWRIPPRSDYARKFLLKPEVVITTLSPAMSGRTRRASRPSPSPSPRGREYTFSSDLSDLSSSEDEDDRHTVPRTVKWDNPRSSSVLSDLSDISDGVSLRT